MAPSSEKDLFTKLRSPLPEATMQINVPDFLKRHKDYIFPVLAILSVSAVILAPEFMHLNDKAQALQSSSTKKFHKLRLPKADNVALTDDVPTRVTYRPDTAEEILSSARIASDAMRFEKAFKDYNKAAQIYFDQERYTQSRAVITKASALLTNHIPQPYEDHLQKDIIAFWGLHALNEKQIGAADDALYAAQLTFEAAKNFYGKNHLETARYYDFLGRFYQNNNDIINALHCQYAALKIYRHNNYYDAGNYIVKMNNLGEHYRLQKDYANSEKVISETIHFIENKFGSDVPELAVPLNNLGLVKYAKQERTKSEAYLMRAYQISRKYQSDDNDVTQYIAENLERVQKGTSL